MSHLETEPVFKKRKVLKNLVAQRKRSHEEGASSQPIDDGSASELIRAARPATVSALKQGSAGLRKAKKARLAGGTVANESDSSPDEADEVGVSYAARRQEARPRSASPKPGDVIAGDAAVAQAEAGLYKGEKAYGSQLPKGSARYGPVKGPDNVRIITMTDYKPDICKDYKETGYCGFGDSCIFLHDRSDYLHGWQMDNMYLSQQAAKSVTQQRDSDEDDVPFACFICRQEFTDPVVTRCGHYFCSACAVKRYSKNSKCAACNAATNGIFNRADKILDRSRKFKRLREHDDEGQQSQSEAEEGAGLAGVEGLQDDAVQ